jgi:hypothetical protein
MNSALGDSLPKPSLITEPAKAKDMISFGTIILSSKFVLSSFPHDDWLTKVAHFLAKGGVRPVTHS